MSGLVRGCRDCQHCIVRRGNGVSRPQQDPLDYLGQSVDPGSVWRRNYSILATFEEQVLEGMHDQASRGQLLVYSEAEARRTYQILSSRHWAHNAR